MTSPARDSRITPIKKLFTYHIFGIPRESRQSQKDIASYALSIGGMVDRELSLSMDQLRNDFAQVSGVMVLQCMTNIHWGRLRFTGTRLLDVLEHAGIQEEAFKIALHGADGYDTDLRLDEVRRRPDAFLLAHSMSDQPLIVDHGFPLRLTADGKYGFKWPKWLSRIELVDYDYKGHYEGKRGWSDKATRGQSVT